MSKMNKYKCIAPANDNACQITNVGVTGEKSKKKLTLFTFNSKWRWFYRILNVAGVVLQGIDML